MQLIVNLFSSSLNVRYLQCPFLNKYNGFLQTVCPSIGCVDTIGWCQKHINKLTGESNLFQNKSLKNIHDKSNESRVEGQGLDYGPHQKSGQRSYFHQLLNNYCQYLLCVGLLLRKTKWCCYEEPQVLDDSQWDVTNKVCNRIYL